MSGPPLLLLHPSKNFQVRVKEVRNIHRKKCGYIKTLEHCYIPDFIVLYFQSSTHSGILGFMTLIPTENENVLVFEKSKWIRKQKLTSNIGFFLEFFPQLILTTGSKNTGPDITVYYGIWAHGSTKIAVALFSDVIHNS